MRLSFLLLALFGMAFGSESAIIDLNAEVSEHLAHLKALYKKVSPEANRELLEEIAKARENLRLAEEKVKSIAGGMQENPEVYAFWQDREITVEKLLIEYGPGDAIYIIPPDIGKISLLIRANLPVPEALWSSVIERILIENGIEIEELGSFVKALKLSKNHALGLSILTDRPEELEPFSNDQRAAYLLHTGFCEAKKTRFLESIAKGHNLVVQLFEQEALIIGRVDRLKAFAKLVRFVLSTDSAAQTKIYWTQKLSAKEAKKLLEVALSARSGKYASTSPRAVANLKVFASEELKHLLLLCGSASQVARATDLIEDIEKEIQDPDQKTVFWYQCKHASAEDIAVTLSKVYPQLGRASMQSDVERAVKFESRDDEEGQAAILKRVEKTESNGVASPTIERFIVDTKTSSIIMIVEKRILTQIQQLIEKLDVPKQMVKIEVLLFEKKTRDSNEFGLESLKVGGDRVERRGVRWDGPQGILNFLLPRGRRGSVPAYDLAYKFLLANRDLQLNSCPSITTMNATPATISIMEEISIDNGITYIENKDQTNPRKSFSREKFGISITLTPTVNPPDPLRGEDTGSITLESNINFESIHRTASPDRPDVTKRHVENQVRIQDGETVVIGGLRKKNAEGSSGKIPFLGQIPGIGKLFSFTNMEDEQTEMFIFITPRIISNDVEGRLKMEQEELKKRPGDIPAFVEALKKAREEDERGLFEGSLKMLFYPSEAIRES